jgi:hypothetical protein
MRSAVRSPDSDTAAGPWSALGGGAPVSRAPPRATRRRRARLPDLLPGPDAAVLAEHESEDDQGATAQAISGGLGPAARSCHGILRDAADYGSVPAA